MRFIARPRAGALGGLALLLFALASDVGARPDATTPPDPLPEGRALVFASDEWCPYVCFESTRAGYLVDLAHALFESPARPVEIRRMSWLRAIREAEAGRIDGVLGAAPGESPLLLYPERAAAGDPVAFAVRSDDPWTFTHPRDLSGRRIGLAQGYRFGPALDDALSPGRAHSPGIEPLATDRPTWNNLQKLVEGRIDTVLDNGHVLRHEVDRSGFFPAVRVIESGIENRVYIAFADTTVGRTLAAHFEHVMRSRAGRRLVDGLERRYGAMDAAP
jgi:polar amino acid transport system substrate-binding protein